MEKCFEYLAAEEITSIAVLYVDNGFGQDGLANVEAIAAENDVEIVATESFGGEDTDMTAQLTKIKAAEAGAVVVWGTNPGPAIIARTDVQISPEDPGSVKSRTDKTRMRFHAKITSSSR